jgi:hypothetical protein
MNACPQGLDGLFRMNRTLASACLSRKLRDGVSNPFWPDTGLWEVALVLGLISDDKRCCDEIVIVPCSNHDHSNRNESTTLACKPLKNQLGYKIFNTQQSLPGVLQNRRLASFFGSHRRVDSSGDTQKFRRCTSATSHQLLPPKSASRRIPRDYNLNAQWEGPQRSWAVPRVRQKPLCGVCTILCTTKRVFER